MDAEPTPSEGRPGSPPRWLLLARIAAATVAAAIIAASIILLQHHAPGLQPSRSAARATDTGSVGDTSGSGARTVPPPVISAPGPVGALEAGFPVKGKPAPNFALNDTEGNRVQLADLRGKVVVVNFWATWCGPCRQEFPELQKAATRRANDVVVLALDQSESTDKVTRFRDQLNATFPILMDSSSSVFNSYGLSGIPDTIFIDRDGTVRDVVPGPLSAGSFQYRIMQILGTHGVQ
jgi:cytochrome c biogenesis protein CcmG/thiol:disulfide interchange protein DsbE